VEIEYLIVWNCLLWDETYLVRMASSASIKSGFRVY